MSNDIREKISKFYSENGIEPSNFHCKYYDDCSKGATEFSTAKASYISKNYGTRNPRLLFLSLDSGSGVGETATLENILAEGEKDNVSTSNKSLHYYRTHELAQMIYETLGEKINIDDVKFHFAHANSAKCCENNPHRSQGKFKMFKNCRAYARGEVKLLAPQILITQGARAKEVVEDSVVEKSADPNIKIINLDGQKVIWFCTPHPRAFGYYYKLLHRKEEWLAEIKRSYKKIFTQC